MIIQPGAAAPAFTLTDHNRREVAVDGLWQDRSVLLVFYPFAFSPVCDGELCQVRDELEQYQEAGTQVVGVSVDTPFALAAWARERGFGFPLLSDFWPHGEVARSYGVFDERLGVALRGTFLIDRGGAVRFSEVQGPREARDQAGWKKAVAALDS